MAARGEVEVGVEYSRRGRRRLVNLDFASQGEVVRRKRPGPRPATRAERIERIRLAWLLMRKAGLTFQEIADITGYAVSTIKQGTDIALKSGRRAYRELTSRHGT